ncbi:MAG TPA: FxLYD domain-containing protein [Halococcus sp.]|nr:FxLYD domain-containing protein [Halococcus sp.]
MNRRKYLAAIGCATTAIFAGCSGGGGGGNDSGTTGNGGAGGTTGNGGQDNRATGSPTPTEGSSEPTATTTSITEQPRTEAGTTATVTGQPVTEAATVTPSGGGGAGTTTVTETELVVEEGEYFTDIYMTGLVENTGSATLRLPEVRVSFYDDADSILETTTASIVFLPSGTRWEIHEPYFGDEQPARGTIEVTSTETFQTELGVPDSLNIVEQNLQTGEEPVLSFRIENVSNNPVSPSAFCVFYDGDGVVLGDGIDYLDQLPPGESWQSSLEFLAYSTQDATRVTDYDLYANTF